MTRGPVAIAGAGAVTPLGLDWRGLGRALRQETISQLPRPLPGAARPTPAAAIGSLPDPASPEEARARGLMSRGALLASIACTRALISADWAGPRDNVGMFLGVGSSGGDMDTLTAMLAASRDESGFDAARFGSHGLRAGNPLFAFQLMNNFTLSHAAILEGIGGPNAAFFSRGSGTVRALIEGVEAIRSSECARTLVGGADSALHAVTLNELDRAGLLQEGLVPGEGAAVLALGVEHERALAFVEHASVVADDRDLAGATAATLEALDPASIDVAVLTAWGPARADTLHRVVAELAPDALVVDTRSGLGEALAASPALAWVVAIDLLTQPPPATHPWRSGLHRALVLSAGVDGELGVTTLASGRFR